LYIIPVKYKLQGASGRIAWDRKRAESPCGERPGGENPAKSPGGVTPGDKYWETVARAESPGGETTGGDTRQRIARVQKRKTPGIPGLSD
jgi:hypothetical protein